MSQYRYRCKSSYMLGLMAPRSPDLLLPLLSASTPVTLEQLQHALGQPSRRTTFRYLGQVRYLRSYNHNGRFYTARDPDRFDDLGLLRLGSVCFSRDRSLAATVLRLLGESAAGYTDKELRALLHVPVHPFLLAAVRQRHACRELLSGVYVYLSAEPQLGARQLQARQARYAAAALAPDVIIAGVQGEEAVEASRRLPAADGVSSAVTCPHEPRVTLSCW